MIHYHGGPITPIDAAAKIWAGRHAMLSFAYPDQLPLAAEVCQSFALDNGAFSVWKSGGSVNIPKYAEWVNEWIRHPGFDWCLIPDVIDGDESVNRDVVEAWEFPRFCSVPVWHLHEPLKYLEYLIEGWPRVALGSSGDYSNPGESRWWDRMDDAMKVCCDDEGRPLARLHGLRMLDPTLFSHLPLASADSCNVARNIGIDSRWNTGYLYGLSKSARAIVLANRIESHASASRWNQRERERSFSLLG